MGKGGFNQKELQHAEYSWEEIRKHNLKSDRWIVIDGFVYNITEWAKNHPGGEKVISGYAGEDASVCICTKEMTSGASYHSRHFNIGSTLRMVGL